MSDQQLRETLFAHFSDSHNLPLLESEIEDIIQIVRPHLGASAAKLRLTEDELKSTKEALETVIRERDILALKVAEQDQEIEMLSEHVGEQNKTMNEMSAQLIRMADTTEGE